MAPALAQSFDDEVGLERVRPLPCTVILFASFIRTELTAPQEWFEVYTQWGKKGKHATAMSVCAVHERFSP